MRLPCLVVLLPVLGLAQPPRFLEAGDCAMCHTRIPPPGESWDAAAGFIGPFPLWQNGMMAHASADPYWKAKVAFETGLRPAAQAAIEDKCLRCHAPAQQYPRRVANRRLALRELDALGEDGVTCTVCHQMTSAHFATPPSFTGSFEIGRREEIYGPHADPFPMPMRHHTGLTPVEGRHVLEAALCGTCHTVLTHPAGSATPFVEQGPYLEWLASSHPENGRTCQTCHLPVLRDAQGKLVPQYIAHRPPGGPFPPTGPRAPFGMHRLAGANVRVLEWLGDLENEPDMKDAAAWTHRQLERAVRLDVVPRHSPGELSLDVRLHNLTGHKLPTAYPSRRVWVHVRVEEKTGRAIFESGRWDAGAGALQGGERPQPHYAVITQPRQVQIFEAEYGDLRGKPTVSLLAAAAYLKDNRIPPAGFRPGRLGEVGLGGLSIASAGVPGGANFGPGFSGVSYRIPWTEPAAGIRASVEVLYQTIKPSHRPPGLAVPAGVMQPVVVAASQVHW